jgi:hypothetical protein
LAAANSGDLRHRHNRYSSFEVSARSGNSHLITVIVVVH